MGTLFVVDLKTVKISLDGVWEKAVRIFRILFSLLTFKHGWASGHFKTPNNQLKIPRQNDNLTKSITFFENIGRQVQNFSTHCDEVWGRVYYCKYSTVIVKLLFWVLYFDPLRITPSVFSWRSPLSSSGPQSTWGSKGCKTINHPSAWDVAKKPIKLTKSISIFYLYCAVW